MIFREIKHGNIPDFLRKLTKVSLKDTLKGKVEELSFYALPDYLAIGDNKDHLYMPMTPVLAQRIAELLHCTLPTRKMADLIYQQAIIKLAPLPIPPTPAMTTVRVFEQHSRQVSAQLKDQQEGHLQSLLTAGNKKDIIISNKIYTENTAKVVIYGWHQLNGKAIQPVYNKHTYTWADYSHGVRLIYEKATLNGKKVPIKTILNNPIRHVLLSDEGKIERAYYPILSYP
ncbi:hypothetical protein D9M68_718930 [compost metagenome]